MNTSVDLSALVELRPLANIAAALNDVADGVTRRWLIVGAMARDLVLHHVHRVPVSRATVDLDIGVAVESWTAFEVLRERLVGKGALPIRDTAHRFLLSGWNIDVVPFGGIEHEGVIAWPAANGIEMTVLGFQEASLNALEVILPDDVRVFVATPPALLVLKVIAWDERHHSLPRHDAYDIRTLILSYSDGWNTERLYGEAEDLLLMFAYDNEKAGAALLGRDAAAIAAPAAAARVTAILQHETTADTLLLAQDMGRRVDQNLEVLRALRSGFSTASSRG
jgi:predicted nucleotidyltransferase